MNIDNTYELMNAIDDNASLNKTINEKYDEEAPLGRHELYPGARSMSLGDPVPEWVKDKYGSGAKAAWNKMRDNSKNMNNNRNPWESVSSSEKQILKEDEEEQAPDQNSSSGGEDVAKKLQDSDYEQFVSILNSDGKSQAFVNYLKSHYKMGDDTLGTIKKCSPSEGVTTCGKLIPTQENISLKKSLGFLDKPGWSEKIINDPINAFDTPTITYAGKYIIDGHHRWSRVYALHGPNAELKVLNFPEISGVSWEDMLKAVQLAIRVNAANLDLRNKVDNPNMLDDKTGKLSGQEYINVACDEVVAAMKAKGYGDTKEAQAVKVAANVAAMAKRGAVPGAEPREFMPQTDKIDGTGAAVEKTLKTRGVIDMTEEVDTMSKSTGRVTLEVKFEEYERYGGGGIRTAKISGKDEFDALLKMCDKMHLYINSDWAEEIKEETGSYPTVKEIIERIGMDNGDGCDYIFYIKNRTSGETLLDAGEPEEDWDDDVDGEFFDGLVERYYDDEIGDGRSRSTPYTYQRGVGVYKNEAPDWWKKSGRTEREWNDAKDSSMNTWDDFYRNNR